MRILAIFLMAALVVACETGPGAQEGGELDALARTPDAPAPITSLPAQRLEPGECGLFLFEVRPPSDFILFEDESTQTVQIVHDGELYRFAAGMQAEAFLPGETLSRSYSGPDSELSFTLEGRIGQDTPSGTRLQDMILTVHAGDGTRVVRPVAGVRRCEDR